MSILIDVKETRTPSIGIKGALGFYDEQDIRAIGGAFVSRSKAEKRDAPLGMRWSNKAHYEVPAPLMKRLFAGNGKVQRPTFMNGWEQHIEVPIGDDTAEIPERLRRLLVSEKAVTFYQDWEQFETDLKRIKENDTPFIDSVLERHSITNTFFANHITRPPKPHQRAGLAFFLRSREIGSGHICLFDEMRTGKTKQAIDIARFLFRERLIGRVLVICPNTIKRTWMREILMDAPEYGIFSTIIQGTKPKKKAIWESLAFFYIVNYAGCRADKEYLYQWQKRHKSEGWLLIVDEAHKIKNPEAQQTRAIMELSPDYSVLMTGTPVANRPEDAFCMTDFVCPSLLGESVWHFQNTFGVKGGYMGRTIQGYKNLDEVKYRLARISMRRKRKDIVFDQTIYQDRIGEMKGDQLKAYNEMRDQLWTEMTSEHGEFTSVKAQNSLVKILRLQQITSGYLPKIVPESTIESIFMQAMGITPKVTANMGSDNVLWFRDNWKLNELDEFIDEYLEDIGKLVIWSRYRPPLEFLSNRYQKHGSALIIGGMKPDQVDEAQVEFQTNPECKIMVCNILSSEGKGFQPATFSFFWDKWWSPHLNKQAEDRTLGIMNPEPTTVISAITDGAIDERMEFVLAAKREWSDMILGDKSGEIRIPVLDKNTLLYLIARPEEAERYKDTLL